MSRATEATAPIVPAEEIERRLAEYRRQGFEHQALPHGVYQEPYLLCPWAGCGFRISAIDFQIENTGDPALYKNVLAGWWQGPGVVGRCPGCGKHVLFSMTEKKTVSDPCAAGLTVLPDNWHQTAYIVG
jgi:hypothetical protein